MSSESVVTATSLSTQTDCRGACITIQAEGSLPSRKIIKKMKRRLETDLPPEITSKLTGIKMLDSDTGKLLKLSFSPRTQVDYTFDMAILDIARRVAENRA